jgi:hypothetical protein
MDQQHKDKAFTHRYGIDGIGKPLFDNFAGKAILVNKDTLATIQVAESTIQGKDCPDRELPPQVKAWAEENHIEIETEKEVATELPLVNSETGTPLLTEEGKPITRSYLIKKKVSSIEPLFTLDSRKLSQYFGRTHSMGQLDVMLERARQEGRNEATKPGGGLHFGMGWVLIIGVGFILIMVVLALMKTGILH